MAAWTSPGMAPRARPLSLRTARLLCGDVRLESLDGSDIERSRCRAHVHRAGPGQRAFHPSWQYPDIDGWTDRRSILGDFLQMRMGAGGEAQIGYADSNSIAEAFAPHGMFVRQNGGNGLLATSSPVNISGLTPYNSAADPSGDGKYEVTGRVARTCHSSTSSIQASPR